MHYVNNTELSSLEETRCQFNGGPGAIKFAEGRIRPVCGLGIDVHQDFYVVVMQVDGNNPKPAQRFPKRSIPALGGQTRPVRGRSARGLRSVRVWLWIAAQSQGLGDQVPRGLSAKVG